MLIGLIDVDGFGIKRGHGGQVYPNLALCKISAYHKARGDKVIWYDMFSGHCDVVYMSKVFVFTPDYPYVIDAESVIMGGTGYDIKKCLLKEIDDMQPDLSIYPDVPPDTSYGFLSRGCPNKCKWCVVPIKEGAIMPYWDIERVANGRKNVILMDNNILALKDYAIAQMTKAINLGLHIDFNQAMDARLVDDELASVIAKVKWLHSRIRFGCDTYAQITHCDRAMALIESHGYRGEFFLYTMLQGEFTECYERINHYKMMLTEHRQTHRHNAVYPYAQPYRDLTNPHYKPPQWQKDLAAWCNKRPIFCSTQFADFEPRKGFKCDYYLKKYYD